ncbi:hypothetical protein [Phormidium yuhuli]|nr:hypothetical protein [Phormidium yuhuli]
MVIASWNVLGDRPSREDSRSRFLDDSLENWAISTGPRFDTR